MSNTILLRVGAGNSTSPSPHTSLETAGPSKLVVESRIEGELSLLQGEQIGVARNCDFRP